MSLDVDVRLCVLSLLICAREMSAFGETDNMEITGFQNEILTVP